MDGFVERFREDFQNEEARYACVEDFLNCYVAAQIKNLREERGLSQEQLAAAIGTKQSGISRIENVNYSSWKVGTLRKLARALGLRLRISFEEFGTLSSEIENFRKSLSLRSFAQDPVFNGEALPAPKKQKTRSKVRSVHRVKTTSDGTKRIAGRRKTTKV